MGVPKFFRWLYERYPCLCEVVREYQIPEFDNLYLDMNGIIHICSHPNDFDPQFRITEEKIFKDIFHYIEILFRMIQPQKLFFMAVDGVAPRAKLNQQRGRRFRTAKEAVDLEKKAVETGIDLPKEERFDSNCITPGTEFMERLHHQLRYFIAYKMSNDKLWKNVKVILSGHETPGEGEHKIMDYIRFIKSKPDYDHNTRHCLYGLDADLIMLGLCTHEPHFSLLREEVKFNKKAKRASTPEGTKFYLLHLSLMRGYLDWEFNSLKDKLPFGYDIEKIIDDWVLMSFLVGNDFIPHLPGLHIVNGALTILHKAYMDILPTLEGYINEEGTLVLSRFQRYMEKLSAFDIHQFKDEYADLKYFEGKTSRKMGASKERLKIIEFPDAIEGEPLEPDASPSDPNLKEMIQFTDMQLKLLSVTDEKNEEDLEQLFGGIEDDFQEEEDDDDDDDEPPNADMYHEFYQKKRDYYTNKLEFERVTPEVLRSQAEGYVRAIQWNLHYYYNGVCSWSWFYPHHYAPYISDIKNFCDLEINFDIGKPFLPFQQLLAVLPSLSKNLLPEPFHSLMVDENSPIIDYYPSTFQTDLNGKRQEWEAVVLIPLIDEERLLSAMEPLMDKLTEEEKRRNSYGPMLVCTYSEESLGKFEAPHFPPVVNNHALEERVMMEEIQVPIEKLRKGLCSNVALDVHFPGFPTLLHVPHKASLQKSKVKVFETTTRGESIILEIQADKIEDWKKDTAELAKELLGRSFQVSWPHLFEAKIIEVLDSKNKYTLGSSENSKVKGNADDKNLINDSPLQVEEKPPEWQLLLRSINEHYNTFLGIQLGPVPVIVRALPIAGRKYRFTPDKVSLEKQWAPVPESFALQTVIKNIKVSEPKTVECNSIHEMFPPETVIFLMAAPHYGSKGQVIEIVPSVPGKVARVKIALQVAPEPKMENVKARIVETGMKYFTGGAAAQRIGINGHLLSRITGTIYISRNDGDPFSKSVNIGLSLKFNKRNQEVPGFTRKDNNTWLYSDRCVNLLNNYIEKFPDLFAYLAEHTNTNEFQESAVFPDNGSGMTLKEVVEWLSQQPHHKVEHRTCGAEVLEEDVVREIEKEVESIKERVDKETKTVTINVQPFLIYKPAFKLGHMQPDKTARYLLYDRVVNVRECYTVPLGLRGTVIGIQRGERQEDTLYDIVFDSSFDGGVQILGCSPGMGYHLPAYALINLSHGERLHGVGNDPAKAYLPPALRGLSSGNFSTRHPNQANTNSSLGGYKSHHESMPDRPASAFASWRSVSGGYQGSPANNSHRGPPKIEPLLNSGFRGKDPIILKRPTPEQSSQQPQQPQQPRLADCSAQFQAIWSELKNNSGGAGSITKSKEGIKTSASYPFLRDANQQGQPEVLESNEAKDSGTDVLKKLLGIDNSSSTPSLVSSSKLQNSQPVPAQVQNSIASPPEKFSQPSVQEFFEKAKAVNAKQQEHQKNPTSHCVQLISLFQRSGLGIPRYDYIEVENGMVIANLVLPNQTTFRGEPAASKAKAAESVAKIALAQMSNWSEQEMKFGGMPMPANKLPAPPQQWCQPPPMQSQQHGHYAQYPNQPPWQNNIYQKLNWREHPEQLADWRRRHNPTQWQGNRPPPPPMYTQRPIHPQYNYPTYTPYQGQHPQWNVSTTQPLWRQPPLQTKPHTESAFPTGANGPSVVNPFVPLQAVRAQMSANSQQVHSPKRQKHSRKPQASEDPKKELEVLKISTSTPKKMSDEGRKVTEMGSKKNDSPRKEVIPSAGQNVSEERDNQVKNEKQLLKEDVEPKSKSKDTKKGKEVYVPPKGRRSRLAIKFGAEQ